MPVPATKARLVDVARDIAAQGKRLACSRGGFYAEDIPNPVGSAEHLASMGPDERAEWERDHGYADYVERETNPF